MRRMTRHVLSELLKVFLITLFGLTLLMLLVILVKEAIQQGLGPLPVLRLIPYVLPIALLFAVPGTILFAVCSVYGRMSSANEVVAIKSIGCSPMTVIWPALALSFVLSLVTVWLNDVAVSWGRQGIRSVVLHSVEQIVYSMLETQNKYSTKRFSITVQDVDDHKLISPIVIIRNDNGKPPMTLRAQEAEIRCDVESDELLVVFRNGFMEADGKIDFTFDNFVHRVPLSDATRKGKSSKGPSHYALREIPEEARNQRVVIETIEKTMAAEAAFQMISGDFSQLADETKWQAERTRLSDAHERLHRLHTEPWRRWANGFSCFCFVLVGAPLAMRLRNSDLFTTFALCFLPILIIYYPLLAYGVDRAKTGALPPYAVWLGNVVLLLVGTWLIRKSTKH